ncbi:MAG: quinolinate synthase NadA [Actinomycetota bacterium]|nr:quinolinate synthase NadA [Actinomycetota bacterium]
MSLVDTSLAEEINQLKKDRNAIVIAHSYERSEVQEVADFVGDSLGLSRIAASTDADVIVFAGVHFMAETASILNPTKKVLLPDLGAGCSLADTIAASDVRKWRDENPDGQVVSYVNTTAEVKALSDVCVTSANAVEVVKSLDPTRPIFFLPDMFLGAYVEKMTGIKMHVWMGECHVHAGIGDAEIKQKLTEFPDAEFLIHPECSCGSSCLFLKPDAKMMSTEGMVKYAAASEKSEFVVATEVGIIHRLNKMAPGKRFLPVKESAVCQYMKMITLEKVRDSLLLDQFEIKVDEEIAIPARRAIEKMIAIG